MARYIDAEKLCKALGDMAFYQNPYKQSTILGVVESIEQFPTADVAPRAEVAIDVLDEAIRAVCSKIDLKIYNTIEGKPLGYGVAFGKQQAMYDVITLLAELKKKYTDAAEPQGGEKV